MYSFQSPQHISLLLQVIGIAEKNVSRLYDVQNIWKFFYYYLPTCFGRISDYHQGVTQQKNSKQTAAQNV